MNFFQQNRRQSADETNPFFSMSEEQLQAHLDKDCYGDFYLTDAVRPLPGFHPIEGYKFDSYADRKSGLEIPVVMAAVSREKLFQVFLSLLEQVGKVVDVAFDSTHESAVQQTIGYRSGIDSVVLQSTLMEYEDVLLNDGNANIAVLNPRIPQELQFDEHKMFCIYADSKKALAPFLEILEDSHVQHHEGMKFLTDFAHAHSSTEDLQRRFRELIVDVGAEEESDW